MSCFFKIRLRILKSEMLVQNIVFILQIFYEKSPSHLFQLIPPNNNVYGTRSSQRFLFSSSHKKWNNLDLNIRIFSSIIFLRKNY